MYLMLEERMILIDSMIDWLIASVTSAQQVFSSSLSSRGKARKRKLW